MAVRLSPGRGSQRERHLPDVGEQAPPAREAETVRMIPVVSAFDLLEGEYSKTQRARMLTLVVAGLSLAVWLAVAAQAVQARFDASAAGDSLARVEAELEAKTRALGEVASVDGVTADQLARAASARAAQALTAVGVDVDLARLWSDLLAVTPPGVRVVLVNVQSVSPEAKKGGGQQGQDLSPGPDSTAPPAGGAQQSPQPSGKKTVVVTIDADADGYEQVSAWNEALGRIPYLSSAQTTWVGSADKVRVSTRAEIVSSTTARAERFAADAEARDAR